jgi:hypothetical protein
MPNPDLERSFPGLTRGTYSITSPPDPSYNCAAWAAGETIRWWDPSLQQGYYWPSSVARDQSVTALVAAFASLGFESCADSRPEPGFEKLAIYADTHGLPTHVARQLPTGTWTSKLGASEDIEHEALQQLEGAVYGRVVKCLRCSKAGEKL